jgi:hypothetical protein
MYNRVHEALGEKIPKPDYDRLSTGKPRVLMQRIALTTAPTSGISERAYIERKQYQAYDNFSGIATRGPRCWRSTPMGWIMSESSPFSY